MNNKFDQLKGGDVNVNNKMFQFFREDRYPWMCSLKETGFRGKHKCGVTLLSGGFFDLIRMSNDQGNIY